MSTADLTTATPQQFDEDLAAIYAKHAEHRRTLTIGLNDVHRAAGDKQTQGRGRRWLMTDTEAEEKARAIAADQDATRYARAAPQRALSYLRDARAALEGTAAQIAERDVAFRARGGWSRFFLVNNTNGHIHSSMDCSTCRDTTQFSWLPTVSGKTEAEAVAEHGPMLCTVCFPSAPVEWTNYWEKEEERKQAESCPGSGTFDWVEGTTRFGYAAGNGGTCSHCDGYAAATASRKIRKHKPGQ